MKKQEGITLIALVITIVVLIILAGVSLYTLFGEDGVITKARESVKVNEWGITKEQLKLQQTDYYLNKNPKEDGKDYIEYFLEDGFINTEAVVQMNKIANNTLKLGRGNLQEGDVYYFENEHLYYIEKTGERVDLGPFDRLRYLTFISIMEGRTRTRWKD